MSAFGCDFNRSMQHLDSHYREGGVENEVSNEDLLHRSRQGIDVGSLGYPTRIYYTEADKGLMWDRWEKGESLNAIARHFGRSHSSIQGILSRTGGIRPPQRQRSQRALTLAEREEISRGVVTGLSLRSIAALLGRAPSTVSREIKRNGGRRHYRANKADEAAWERAPRPKTCKLAQNRALARIVAEKLQSRWSPRQIAGWLKRTYPDDENFQVSLYPGPWGLEERALEALEAHAWHAPFAPSHTEDGRSRAHYRHRVDPRATGRSRGSRSTRPLGR